jgi:hypothetical protein
VSDTSSIGSSGGPRELAEYVDGLPNLSGAEALIAETIADAAARAVFAAAASGDPFAGIQSAFAIAAHTPAADPRQQERCAHRRADQQPSLPDGPRPALTAARRRQRFALVSPQR